MSTTLTVEPSVALAKLVEQYHLEPTMGERLSTTFLPYFKQAKNLLEEAAGVNVTDPTQVTEINQSGDIRRKLKALRCEAEAKRKEIKEPFWQACQAIDFAPKLLASQTEPVEKRLLEGEKIAERMEQERLAKVREERYTKIKPLLVAGEIIDSMALGGMTVVAYEAMLAGLEQRHTQREAARRREIAAQRLAAAKQREEQAKLVAAAEAQRVENERLRKERAEKDAAYEAQLASERSAAAALARKEQEARQKAEAELAESVRAAQELQAQRDAMRAREEAERKAAAVAPDKDRLIAMSKQVHACQRARENFSSKAAADVAEQANVALVKLSEWLVKKAGTL
jgi:septal ring factor EnvC (AmiA/AmiB activator)